MSGKTIILQAQGKVDFTVEAFEIEAYGEKKMAIPATEECIYLTKAEACKFFNLVPAPEYSEQKVTFPDGQRGVVRLNDYSQLEKDFEGDEFNSTLVPDELAENRRKRQAVRVFGETESVWPLPENFEAIKESLLKRVDPVQVEKIKDIIEHGLNHGVDHEETALNNLDKYLYTCTVEKKCLIIAKLHRLFENLYRLPPVIVTMINVLERFGYGQARYDEVVLTWKNLMAKDHIVQNSPITHLLNDTNLSVVRFVHLVRSIYLAKLDLRDELDSLIDGKPVVHSPADDILTNIVKAITVDEIETLEKL